MGPASLRSSAGHWHIWDRCRARGVFEKSALRAIERWRYRPAVIDGRAAERRGLRVKLSFELDEA